MYNKIIAILWLDGQEVRWSVLEASIDINEMADWGMSPDSIIWAIASALDSADDDDLINITGDADLWDGLVVDGTYCEDACKRWFEINSIDYIGASYASLVGGGHI